MFSRILIFLTIGLVLVSQTAAQQAGPLAGQVTVPKRAVLTFATIQALDSATAKVGDDVPLSLMHPLVVDGVVLLPAGEMVHGTVTKVKRAGRNGRYGWVEWKLRRIQFADGSTAKVTVGYLSESDLSNWDGFMLMLVLAPFILLCLPLILHDLIFGDDGPTPGTGLGKEFLLPAGSEVPITVTKDHRVRF